MLLLLLLPQADVEAVEEVARLVLDCCRGSICSAGRCCVPRAAAFSGIVRSVNERAAFPDVELGLPALVTCSSELCDSAVGGLRECFMRRSEIVLPSLVAYVAGDAVVWCTREPQTRGSRLDPCAKFESRENVPRSVGREGLCLCTGAGAPAVVAEVDVLVLLSPK